MKSEHSDIESTEDIEAMLAALKPQALSDDLLAKLSLAMYSTEMEARQDATQPRFRLHSREETQVKFIKKQHSQKWINWGIAAAVVFFASLSAIFVSNQSSDPHTIIANVSHDFANESYATDSVSSQKGDSTPVTLAVPGDDISNQQTIWINNTPHRFSKYTQYRTVKKIDENGNEVELSVPETTYTIKPDIAY